MPRYGICWNDREHEDQARRDARYGRRDYEMYDRYTSDPCKEVYTEEYDRECRRIERQQEERAEEERLERHREERRYQESAEIEASERAYYEQQQYPEPQLPDARDAAAEADRG